MFCVYEVYTWDDVSYRKPGEYETEAEAKEAAAQAKEDRRKIFKPSEKIPVDPVNFIILTDLQYYLLMK